MAQTAVPEEMLYSVKPRPAFKPGGIVLASTGIDGGFVRTYDIRPGWAMGMITSSGLYVPCKRTRVNGTSGSVTQITVDNPYAFIVGDVITVGTDANKTITAIDYTAKTIDWSGAITVADNDVVYAQDGSAVCRGFLADGVRLRNSENTAAATGIGKLLTGGSLNQGYLKGDIDSIIAAKPAMVVAGTNFLDKIQIWSSGIQVL